MPTVNASITDVIDMHDDQVVGFVAEIDETFGMPDLLSAIRATPGSITDGIGINDAIVGKLGVLVAEQLNIGDTWSTKWIGSLSISESIFLSDATARGLPVTLNDGIGLNFALTAGQLVNVIEQLGLRDIVAPVFKYNISIAEQLQFADTLARFIGAGIIENLQFAGTPIGVGQMYAAISDGLALSADLSSSRLVLTATIQDGIDITDAELVKMIFQGVIQEGIQIAAGYFEPSGSITTWAMNTRTHAVTEYTNYSFNSFARIGNKYLGATKDGLYDLSGDTDAGTDIIADIKSGLAQFAGVHLSSFKGAYIAARGGGSYVLKLFTGTGEEYHFSVTTDSMKTARIDLGKGIRARYFAFELISSGQDFDLDSLEFIPLIAKRRV